MVFLVIAWQRLVFYVRWVIYSRRYEKVHDFIGKADLHRRRPVEGLVERPKETKS